jgi:hypothetical protein
MFLCRHSGGERLVRNGFAGPALISVVIAWT